MKRLLIYFSCEKLLPSRFAHSAFVLCQNLYLILWLVFLWITFIENNFLCGLKTGLDVFLMSLAHSGLFSFYHHLWSVFLFNYILWQYFTMAPPLEVRNLNLLFLLIQIQMILTCFLCSDEVSIEASSGPIFVPAAIFVYW